MARDAGRVNLQMSGREILQIIYDDLKNTGFKILPDVVGSEVSVDTSATNYYDGVRRFKWTGSAWSTDCDSTCTFPVCPDAAVSSGWCRWSKSQNKYVTCTNGCTDIIKDSASFYNANGYLFYRPLSNPLSNSYIFQGSSGCSGNPACSSFVNRYDTLGVLMGKLDKDGLWEGDAAYKINYRVQDSSKLMLIRTVISPSPKHSTISTVLAKDVAAFKVRFSDNLKDWYDYFKS